MACGVRPVRTLWLTPILFAVATRVRKLRIWAKSCPQNFEAHYLIARAEWLRIGGFAGQADVGFDRAIAGARAQRLLEHASDAYDRWGAVIKADALKHTRSDSV